MLSLKINHLHKAVMGSVAQRKEESRIINISHLHSGIYFVRVRFEGGSSVKKMVKQ